MDAKKQYQAVFQKVFQIDPAELGENFTFQSRDDWTSLTHLALITDLEDAFGVMFATDDILHFGSYLNGIRILERYGVQF